MKLTFDQEAHVYRVDGRIVPSVTTVLKRAGRYPDYSAVPAHVLERARQRGIHVHTACEYYDQGDLDLDTVHAQWRPYVEAWIAFRKDRAPTALQAELRLYHPDLDYAGTCDLYCRLDAPTVIDRKTSQKIHADSYALQLAAYTMPGLYYATADGDLMPLPVIPPPPRRLIVQLTSAGKYREYPCTRSADYQEWEDIVAAAKKEATR